MNAKAIALASSILAAALLAGCGNDAYTPNDENCKSEHWRTLPEGEKRDALVEACMKR